MLKDLTYSYVFEPIYSSDFFSLEELKQVLKIWRSWEKFFLGMLGNHGTLQQIIIKLSKEFNQRFAFRDYETFTGHLNFIWRLFEDKTYTFYGRYLAKIQELH